jgi:hypothetical protein
VGNILKGQYICYMGCFWYWIIMPSKAQKSGDVLQGLTA